MEEKDNEKNDITANQSENKHKTEHLKPWMWKKGQSGNPKGRTPGLTMKEYSRNYLAKMTEEERQSFLNGLPKDVIWKMAEGNPEQEVKGGISISELINKLKPDGYNTTKRTEEDPAKQEVENEKPLQDN